MMDWRSGLILASIGQSIVLAALLWRARTRDSDRWLAAALLVLAGMMIVYPLGWRGREEVPVWLAFLPLNLPLALGPLLYFYTRGIAQLPLPRRPWVHLLPAALHFFYLLTLSLLPPMVAWRWKEDIHDDIVKPLVEVAVLVSLAGYSLAGLAVMRGFGARLAAVRSDVDRHDARWLSRLLATLLGSFAVLAGVRVYTYTIAELGSGIHIMWLAVWSAWLGVEGWRVAAIPPPKLDDVTSGSPELQGRDWKALGADWHARTREGGWWREPDLTLASLARRLGTNTLYLSRGINEGLGINFNEMINRLRVEDVARAIDAGAGRAELLPAAFAAGFRSKATFNRAFRATYGTSPSGYRRRIGQDIIS